MVTDLAELMVSHSISVEVNDRILLEVSGPSSGKFIDFFCLTVAILFVLKYTVLYVLSLVILSFVLSNIIRDNEELIDSN